MYKQTSVLIALSRMGCWAQWLSEAFLMSSHILLLLTDLRVEDKSQNNQQLHSRGVLYKYLGQLCSAWQFLNSSTNKSHFLLFVPTINSSYCHPFPELKIFLLFMFQTQLKRELLGYSIQGILSQVSGSKEQTHSGMECAYSAKEDGKAVHWGECKSQKERKN